MRKILFFCFLLMNLGIFAQEKSATTDYVILMSDLTMADAVMQVATSDFRDGHFRIVFYGPALRELNDDKLQTFRDYAMKYKVELAVCKLSMQKLGLKENDIPKAMEVVENAFTDALRLQQKGYLQLRL